MHWTTEPRGTPLLRVGNDVGVDVGNDVGVKPPRPRVARAGPAGLRSLPAKQHAPKARPSPATHRGRRGVVPGRPSSTNGCAVGTCAAAGCRTFALDGQASRPAGTTTLPASLVASKPGGEVSPRTPLHRRAAQGSALRTVGAAGDVPRRRRCQRSITAEQARKAAVWRTDRNNPPSLLALLLRSDTAACRSERNARLAGWRHRVTNRWS
jgi:hypothetical protein